MMRKRKVSQQQVDNLLDDAAYLQSEAEALRYVIEQVPYGDEPPEGKSIYSMLSLIDHAQIDYYRPLFEKIFSENRLIKLSGVEHFDATFEISSDGHEKKDLNVDKLLKNIIKHRAGILTFLRKMPLIDWERELKDTDGQSISMYQFVDQMVKAERKVLKDIADLVLIYQNEKLSTREITARAKQRKQT